MQINIPTYSQSSFKSPVYNYHYFETFVLADTAL